MPDWKFNCSNEVEVSKYLKGHGGNFPKSSVDHSKHADTQYEIFKVKFGQKYRFRVLGLIGQNFPIRFSIEGHKFTAIAADSIYIKPIRNLTNLWVAAGERFDIIVQTKKNTKKKGSFQNALRWFHKFAKCFHSIMFHRLAAVSQPICQH